VLSIIKHYNILFYFNHELQNKINFRHEIPIIPITRKVKVYTFVGKYVTGRRKRFRTNKVHIFLFRITSLSIDLATSVCLSEDYER